MMVIKSKKLEYELFDKYSEEWWNEVGKFKILHKIRPIRMKYIIDQIGKKNLKNMDILDIGCGGGLISESLSRLGGKVTGIDFVEKNIEVAKKHSKKSNLTIEYKCLDIEKIDIRAKYDLIIIFEVLEHLDDWKYFLLKIKKNLKPNGKIILSTINKNLLSKFLTINIAENLLNWIPKGTHDYNKYIRPEEIFNLIENEKVIFKNLRGLIFNPILNNWMLSEITKVNYFCTLEKVN